MTLENAHHYHQNDSYLIHPLEIEMRGKRFPKRDNHYLVLAQTWLWLSFLYRAGIHNYTFDIRRIERGIDGIRKDHVRYLERYVDDKKRK